MTLVEITVTIDDAIVQPRIDDAWRDDRNAKPPRAADLIRDLVREGSLGDLMEGDSFFTPIVTVRVDGEAIS